MPRTRIQRSVDAAKEVDFLVASETVKKEQPSERLIALMAEGRFRQVPSTNFYVDLDTGLMYLDPKMLKVLQ
jgi:hypothetical protein